MKVVPQKVEVMAMTPECLCLIEYAGRTCYKSEDKITQGSAEKFVRRIIKSGHDSVLEHASMTVRITTDRGISHEIVRHRIGMSYSQESTRYVKYGGEMEFVDPNLSRAEPNPPYLSDYDLWVGAMNGAERAYKLLIDQDVKPQHARSVLPNSLKTEIVVTGNFRAWRHFLKLRLAKAAHPQIREIARMVKDLLPAVIVEDIEE